MMHFSGRIYYLIVILMEIVVGAEVDIIVPSFPEMRRVFNLSAFAVELTYSANLLAQFCACLFIGNLGDRYGRKPVMLYGLGIFIIGSIFCVWGELYWHVLIGRILQGIGIAAPAVLAYLILADRYSPQEQQHMMATLNAVITAALACGPVVGSYVSLYFGWKGNFIVLLIGGTLCFFACFLLPSQHERTPVRLSLAEYLPILQSRNAMAYIWGITLLIVPYWTFIGIAPLLYMDGLHVDLESFGFYQGALCAVFALASMMTRVVVKQFGEARSFYSSLALILLFVGMTLWLIYIDTKNPVLITVIMLLASIGVALPFVIIYPLSLEAVSGARGRISALIFALRMVLVALLAQIVSYFYNGSFTHLGLVLVGIYLIAIYLCCGLYQKKGEANPKPLH